MFRAFCLTILLSIVTCGPRILTDGHIEDSLQSSQLGEGKIQMDTTQVSFQNETSDDHNVNITKSSLHSQIKPLVPFLNNEVSEMKDYSSSDHTNSFRSNKNITNGYGKEQIQKHTASMQESIERLRWPRDGENISSSQLARLAVTLKTAEIENNELKAKVKELQGTAEKLTTRLLEVEAKSSVVMEATAAQQQQQMTTGQLQLQISQLSTKMLKLQEENEALHAQLQNVSEMTSAKTSKLQDENEALRKQLHNISEMTSAKTTKLQDETQALHTLLHSVSQEANLTQTQLQNISALTAGLQAENRSIYAQVQTLTNDKMAHHAQVGTFLQMQASLLDSKLREIGNELTAVNRSLCTQNTAFEDRLNLQISQLRKGDQDLMEKIMKHTSAQAVGFHARLSSSTNITSGRTLVLDRAEYNAGGGYSSSTGVFIVPVTGLYLFLLNIAADTGKSEWIYVFLDNTELCRTWSRYSTELEMASCHVAARVVKGQRVSLKANSDGRIRGNMWTTFTGVLIQREY